MSEPIEYITLPTVREVLALPELLAGEPEVLASERALEAQVRWAHVVAGANASTLLDGGELILTTGEGWPHEAAKLGRLATSLIETGVAAIVLELGTNFSEAPTPLVEQCRQHDVALIVLRSEVRFVQVTQRVHRRILAAQNEALQAREQVHRMLTELGLNRSPVDYVIEQIAATLDAPVVLENIAGEVIAWSGVSANADPTQVLANWAATEPPDPGLGLDDTNKRAQDRVPVEARGTRWGMLTALPGLPHPAGRRTVLELGAFALALGRLSDAEGDQWVRLSSKRLLDTLINGRYRRDTDLATQLTASGLPIEGRTLMGVALTGTGTFGSHETLERAVLETALRRAVAPEGRAIIADANEVHTADRAGEEPPTEVLDVDGRATTQSFIREPTGSVASDRVSLLAVLSLPDHDARVDPAADQGSVPPLATRLARELEMLVPTTTPQNWHAHLSLGVAGRGVGGLLNSVEGVRATGKLPAVTGVGRVQVQQPSRQPLAYLVRSFAGSPLLQEYVQETLGPLFTHDRDTGPGHTGDLVEVLASYLAHPTNRSLAATRARLSRSVFYQRLALIEDLLDIDLADGQTIATLAVALTGHNISN